MQSKKLLSLMILGSLLSGYFVGAQAALVYGLETCDPGSPCSSIGTGTASTPPASLFSFADDGSGLSTIANVTVAGTPIDADGLALSATYGLLAYQVTAGATEAVKSSQLISINPATAVAAPIGSLLSGRNIRGAMFDLQDRLWVVDAVSDSLLQINPSTGSIVGSPTALSLGGSPFSTTSWAFDIAINRSGASYLVDDNEIYSLNLGTGALTLLYQDTVLQSQGNAVFNIGAAFSMDTANPLDLFVLEVSGNDDIYKYDASGSFARSTLYPNFTPGLNSGRGDLASLMSTVPVPATAWLFGSGLLSLVGMAGRKKV